MKSPKRFSQSSRRRQNTPQSQFNEIVVNLVDSCITFDNTRLFHFAVKKSEFPTYHDIVKNPIDLSTIKARAKRCEYKTLEEFRNDMKLLKENSVKFNGENSHVTNQAQSILDRMEALIESDLTHIKELEAKVAAGVPENEVSK